MLYDIPLFNESLMLMKTMNSSSIEEPPSIDLVIDKQLVDYQGFLPSDEQMTQWVEHTLSVTHPRAELAIVIIDTEAMQQYNAKYRQQNKSTNVLSFPAEVPEGVPHQLLGDILVCPHIINQEAEAQQIAPSAHWSHIIIHGILHLLGYDHISTADAIKMEAEEIRLLAQLGVANPYE